MKKIIFLLIAILSISLVSAATWVDDPNDCPTLFQSQNCLGGERMCGYDSGIVFCYDMTSLSAPVANDTTSTNNIAGFDGGYLLDCEEYDGGEPHCDNSGAFWCDRNSSCYGINRLTNCIGGSFGVSDCSTCISGYTYCDGSYTDGDGCEIDIDTTSYPSENNSVYNSSCSPACTGSYLDCDGDLGTAGDGCEILDGGACTIGTLPGTYSGCDGAVGNCVIDKSYFETGTNTEYSTSDPLLWGSQWGSGFLINMTNGTDMKFGVNNSGCIMFADGTNICSGASVGLWTENGDDIYLTSTSKKVILGDTTSIRKFTVVDESNRNTSLTYLKLGSNGNYTTTNDIHTSNAYHYTDGHQTSVYQANLWHYGIGSGEETSGYISNLVEMSASNSASKIIGFNANVDAATTTGTAIAFYDSNVADYTLASAGELSITSLGSGSNVYLRSGTASGIQTGDVEIDVGLPTGGGYGGDVYIAPYYADTVRIMSTSSNAPITFGSGIAFDFDIVSGDHNLLGTNMIVASGDDSGDRSLVLPNSACDDGRTYIIYDRDGDAATYPIRISGAGYPVNGKSEIYLTTDYGYAIVIADESSNEWIAMGPDLRYANNNTEQLLYDYGTINCNNRVNRICSSGGPVVLNNDPAISDGYTDGQLCTITYHCSTAGSVVVYDGYNVELAGGANRSISTGDTLTVMWSQRGDTWYEVSYSDN